MIHITQVFNQFQFRNPPYSYFLYAEIPKENTDVIYSGNDKHILSKIKQIRQKFSLDGTQKRKLNRWRKKFIKNNPDLFINFTKDDFYLFRYGNLDGDFLEKNWPRGLKSLYMGLIRARNISIKLHIIRFLASKDTGGAGKFFQKARAKAASNGTNEQVELLKVFLDIAIAREARNGFLNKLKNKNSKILEEISFEEFQIKNGREYPRALQLLRYDALHVLLRGLSNPDARLRIHYLKAIEKIKTGYNRRFILKRLYPFLKSEKDREVKRYLKRLVGFFEKE